MKGTCAHSRILPFVVVLWAAGAPAAPSGDASYMITFETRWSPATHPQDYPADAHFSPFIGVTHDATVSFWQPGGIASPGVRDVAELGDGTNLVAEFSAAIAQGGAAAQFQSSGFFPADVPSTSTVFTVGPAHTRITVLSMLAPSPDWFAGVREFDLAAGDAWLPFAEFDLHAYDAGSDGGTTYTSPDQPLAPPAPIQRIDGPPLSHQGAVAAVLRVKIQRIDQPFCDIRLNQREYLDGDTLSAEVWRLANLGSSDAAVELKTWLSIPGGPPVSLMNLGSDGLLVFPPGLDIDAGPVPLFTIDPSLPRGSYELGCRVLDPVTGEARGLGRNVLEIR